MQPVGGLKHRFRLTPRVPYYISYFPPLDCEMFVVAPAPARFWDSTVGTSDLFTSSAHFKTLTV